MSLKVKEGNKNTGKCEKMLNKKPSTKKLSKNVLNLRRLKIQNRIQLSECQLHQQRILQIDKYA